VGASAGPEAVRDRIEVRLEDRLQHQLERHLDQSVFKRGNAQRSEFSRLARLRNQPLPDRLRPVASLSQFLPNILQKACDAIRSLFDCLTCHAIRAGCVAAPVAGQPFPGTKQRSVIAYDIEQIREPLAGVRSTPPIQLALHVENELGIHRVGQAVPLLLASCIHCPPSPCGRFSRPRTTMRAPTPPRAFAGRFGHPSHYWKRKRGRYPKFHRCSWSALGADSTPCGFRPPGLAGFPGC
jgi:hypothetical protein